MSEEQDNLPQTRLFWVSVTVFGGTFTSGVGVLFSRPLWGSILILTGLIGLAVLIRDRLKAIPVRAPLLALVAVMASLFIGYISSQLMSISRDIESYVIPRKVTEQQAEEIRAYLIQREPHAVTLKVNPLDAEAREYWSQISNALKRASWVVEMNTSSAEPYTLNDGLCIHEQGINSKPKHTKTDPKEILQHALENARISVNCGGSASAGEYKLFLLVGHRPLIVGWQPPLLSRLGRWLESISR